MNLIGLALQRSRTVLLTLLLLLVAGLSAYETIPKESDPDINIPIIYVSLHHDGISPEDSERLLLRPMEQYLTGIDGIQQITSTAYQHGGNVTLEFQPGFNPDRALRDVRERVDEAKVDLPEETDEPDVSEVNLSLFPVLTIHLAGNVPERTLLRLSRNLQDSIESISSVLEARIQGDREEVVEVIIDPLLLESYQLNGNDILTQFARSNRLVAAGNIDTGSGRFAVTLPSIFETAQDVWNMPIKVQDDAVIRVRDVAQIRRTFKDPDSFSRINGQPALSIEVVKRTGENIIDTIEWVKAVVERESQGWPEGVQIEYAQDRSKDIKLMLTDLENNVISAILLVMIVCVAALGVRSALLIGIAIPGSFLTGILALSLMGLTINVVVLFALILSVGILVDGAIVVAEYATRRLQEGADGKTAYREAAERMAWPIFSSTLTTLAAFLPLLFWPDMVGEFMRFLPITLIAVLSASLAMALIFLPTIGATVSRFTRAKNEGGGAAADGELDADGLRRVADGPFTRAYLVLLERVLRRPGLVLTIAAAMLIGSVAAYAQYGRGIEFFPDVEPDSAVLLVHARGNLSIWEQDALVQEVEQRVLAHPGIETVHAVTGSDNRSDVSEDTIGQIYLNFGYWRYRDSASEILEQLREKTADLAGIQVELRKQEQGPGAGKAIEIEVSSLFPDLIEPVVAQLRAEMDKLPGLVDIEDSRPIPGIEWRLAVDRSQAAKFGLDVTGVGDTVRLVTNGLKVGEYRPDDADDEIDIQIRYPASDRGISQLDRVRVASGIDGQMVPISNFVERIPQPQIGTINRRDGQRVITLKADVEEGLLANDMIQLMRGWVEEANIDPRIEIEFRGEDEDQRAASSFLSGALTTALFLIGIVLVTQFNSFSSTVMILSAVVMSTIGVLIGLLVTNQPFGIVMCGVGVIALAGIVVNNNIVLIDTYDRLIEELGDVKAAIMETCRQRLRPVLLTTVTTILGLMPMVLSMNIDFLARDVSFGAPSTQWWVQLSTSIAFGLAFSTLLTLLVTPSALMARGLVMERLGKPLSMGLWRKSKTKEADSGTPDGAVPAAE
ncbi:MAG: efflux RND transporter permease subunit [Alphaproteobacteria bacterium]|nr:efflux RND transporter permease subunit [Alphaproteobacteria bacterium SS10]